MADVEGLTAVIITLIASIRRDVSFAETEEMPAYTPGRLE
jgi:hypothetical protein